MPLTTNKIEGKKFYLGQAELAALVTRIIRFYQFHNDNESPKEVVIPLLSNVEGVKITYERGNTGKEQDVEPGVSGAGDQDVPNDSEGQEPTPTVEAAG